MAKNFVVQFGVGNPTLMTGLSPTFVNFKTVPGGTNATPPGITEIPTATGLYYFTYGPTTSTAFLIDAVAAVTNTTQRYLSGVLDPIQSVDEKIGVVGDSFGTTAADPTTIFGYVKRLQEFNEGNSTFNKTTGAWDIYSRGSSTELVMKTLSDAAGVVSKS